MTKKLMTALGVLALMALPVLHTGCAGADDANASDGENGTVAASDSGQDASDKKDDKSEDKKSDDADKKGRKGKKGDKDDDKKKEEAVPVEVASLARGPIESVLRFSANLEAENQVKVHSQASRLVTKLNVEEGDLVSQGQVLVQLQDDEQRNMVEKVTAQLAKADREYARTERLFKQELVSEQEYNDATYERDQLHIELANAERELSYTKVEAPIAGRITARMVNLGDQVQINQHLFDIVDFESIVARVFVPERHLAELRPGLQARLSSDATGGRSYAGSVNRIAPIVDPQTGTVKVTDRRRWAARPAARHVRRCRPGDANEHRRDPRAQAGAGLRQRSDVRLPPR